MVPARIILPGTEHTVVPVCEVVQVDAVDVGGEGALGRVPVALQVSLEAIAVEVGAAAIARPTGERERRRRAVFLGVSRRGQVRVFECRGGFNRGRVGISRTTAICVDYGALERAGKHNESRLTVSNRLDTIAVLSEQVRAICIHVRVEEEEVGQGDGELHDEQVAVVAFDHCVVLTTTRVYVLRDVGGDCSHRRRSDSRCGIGVRDRRVLRPWCVLLRQ